MELEEVIGLFAGVCTTIAAIPQIVKAWRSKKVNDVSPWMFSILILGVLAWTLYGFLKMDYPIIVTNGASVILNSIMFVLILKYKE